VNLKDSTLECVNENERQSHALHLFLSVRPFYIPNIMAELVVPMSVSVLEDNVPQKFQALVVIF
jgi:hypothetical protein